MPLFIAYAGGGIVRKLTQSSTKKASLVFIIFKKLRQSQ